jgi:regulator of cell morphogenesis and NO signaling
MKPKAEQTISDIVRADYRTADVFKKYGINYCCSGQATLAAACDIRKLDTPAILEELGEVTRNVNISASIRFNEWKIGFLVEYIINLHHDFLYQAIPAIEARLTSFVQSHGDKYPEVKKVLNTFKELAPILITHSREEEEVIFPYINQIDAARRSEEPYGKLLVRTMRKPLEKNEKDHHEISRLLLQLGKEANNYEFPANACVSHQVLYHKLRELHDDIVQHTHLENNVLIPKAIALEKELLDFGG